MSRETDDYQSDIRFGEWLQAQRNRAGLTLEAAAKSSAISAERLKSLELGYSERGITRAESIRLCAVYGIGLEALLAEAMGA